ncbi:MAG: hypothetical protein HGGPFJEG_01036 [Ignavibacteria bacterium]|nr:hypothetical protein [Ignavibacteria bacterium]
MKYFICLYSLILIAISSFNIQAQTKLKPGFIPEEFAQLLQATSQQGDSVTKTGIELSYPQNCRMVYRSPEAGLSNRWDLWIRDDSVGIISIRGTVNKPDSWSENFFAAMVSAKGSMTIDSDYVFIYKLSEKSKAGVHAGWLIGLAYLAPAIITKINEHYPFGIKEYLIIGHSQGGALAALLYSYLHYLDGERIPKDVKFKVYCSAPPKPGNLFFAYDFDFISRGGWALRVFNTEDWVPQMPFSVQTFSDFSKDNPYNAKDSLMEKMTFIQKIIFEYMLGRIKSNLDDASGLIQDYTGKDTYENVIRKYLPGFPKPDFMNDSYFYPCGYPVVLTPQQGYGEFLKTEKDIPYLFIHHMPRAYYFLLEKIYFEKQR